MAATPETQLVIAVGARTVQALIAIGSDPGRRKCQCANARQLYVLSATRQTDGNGWIDCDGFAEQRGDKSNH